MAHTVADADRKAFRCLVADDSAFARKNIALVLEKIGGSMVGEASNGLEAVELFGKLRPDLVLLDITMPLQDGVETLRKIMEQDKNATVIVVSSIGHKEMIWKTLRLGAKNFVTKPFSADYAALIIRDALDKKSGGAP
jgi:two-component system, chemotaxis family, chemotaxis protein CheY